MAFGGTVDFGRIGVGDNIKLEMTVSAENLAVHRVFVLVVINIEEAQVSGLLVYSRKTRIFVTDDTTLFIGRYGD